VCYNSIVDRSLSGICGSFCFLLSEQGWFLFAVAEIVHQAEESIVTGPLLGGRAWDVLSGTFQLRFEAN
jgi:hypothetical protein